MTDTIVSSGQTLNGATLSNAGDTIHVLNGGTLVAAEITAGYVDVSSGGRTLDTVLSAYPAMEVVEAGGLTSGTVVDSGGDEFVYGTAAALTLNSGASGDVGNGGVVSGGTVNIGSELGVGTGGSATSVTVNSGGLIVASGSGNLQQLTLNAGAAVRLDGLYATSVALVGGNQLEFIDGGSVMDTITLAGATSGLAFTLSANAPGVPEFELLVGRGYTVSSGVTSSGLVLGIGDVATVLDGGGVVSTTVGEQATEILSSGAVGQDATVNGGGAEHVLSGAVASNTLDFGSQYVSSGGVAVGGVISGRAFVDGLAIANQVASGGDLVLSGVASGVKNAGRVEIYSGGQSFADVISGSATEILFGGVASGTTVLSGGLQILYGGNAIASATVVSSGGEIVGGYGAIVGLTVVSGALIGVPLLDPSSVISVSGSQLSVVSSGVVIATIGLAGPPDGLSFVNGESPMATGFAEDILVGSAYVVSSAVTSQGRVIAGGDSLVVVSGGLAEGNTFSPGGGETLSSGGLASGETVLGGLQTVLPGAVSLDTTVGGGGLQMPPYFPGRVDDLGVTSGAVVSEGGVAVVESGGTASATTVLFRGSATISSGAVAVGLSVQSGGSATLAAGGTIADLTLTSGADFTDLGGTLTGLTASSGARFRIVDTGYEGAVGLIDEGAGQFVDYASGQPTVSFTLAAASGVGVALGALDPGEIFLGSGYVASTGITSAGLALSGGDALTVGSGGVASGVTLGAAGAIYVVSGGTDSGATISSDGTVGVAAGGTATGDTVLAYGQETVQGLASAVLVESGGFLLLLSGGVVSSATISSGGMETVYAGGSAIGVTVKPGGDTVVSSGGVASATLLSGLEQVSSGAASFGATVFFGGDQFVLGSASGTILSSGGLLDVFGVAGGDVVSAGGAERVHPGGVASGETVQGGMQTVYAGGLSLSAFVGSSLGSATPQPGSLDDFGVTSGATIGAGGFQKVWSGGMATATTVLSGGTQFVYYGAASGTVVSSGGLIADLNGTIDGLVVSSGAAISLPNFSGGSVTVSGSELVVVGDGGVYATIGLAGPPDGLNFQLGHSPLDPDTSGQDILIGSAYVVSSGVTSQGMTFGDGDSLVVLSGGLARGNTVSGAETVSSGGGVSGEILQGGSETVLAGGSSVSTSVGSSIAQSGLLDDFGLATGATVTDGGQASIESGGIASALTVLSNGAVVVSSGATVFGLTVQNGGFATLYAGGVISGLTVASGGFFSDQGGTFTDLAVTSGAHFQLPQVPGGFPEYHALVHDGAGQFTLYESSDQLGPTNVPFTFTLATASGVGIAAGLLYAHQSDIFVGSGYVASAGVTSSGLTLSGGDTLTVASGGAASRVNLGNAGAIYVSGGGTEFAATISAGGALDVEAGGSATGDTVLSDGQETVQGFASATQVEGGGSLLLLSGGVVSSATILYGGVEIVASGGVADGVTIGFGAEAVISSGGLTSATTVEGYEQMAAGGASFGAMVAPGGYDEVSGLAAAAIVSAGGVLSLDSGGVASGATVLGGGHLFIGSGASALGGSVFGGGVETIEPGAVVSGVSLSPGATVDLAGVSVTSAYVDATNTLVVTSAGTVVESIALGSPSAGLTASITSDGGGGSLVTVHSATSDFNAGGFSDLTWRNTNGDAGIWVTSAGGGFQPTDFGVVDNSWRIQAVGDFNADGKADILWRNTVTGQVGEWLSKPGAGYAGFTAPILATVESAWKIEGVGDFNGDGLSDILWRNSNGDTGVWLTTAGGGYTSMDFGMVDNSWQIQGVGDFNGDGKADILWRNNVTGQVGEWLSNAGPGYAGFTAPILATVDPSWKIAGVGDFSGAGLSDILWRNTNGDTGVWITTAGGGFQATDFGVIDSSWQIQGVGDYNGDGKADILWRNTATGQVGEWLSKPGPGYAGFTAPILATVESSWVIQGEPPALQGGTGANAASLAQAMASLATPTGAAGAIGPPSLAPSIHPVIAAAARP